MEKKQYGGQNNPFEPIKIINHYNLNFNIGNVIKYVLRDKGSKLEDLKKAVDYLQNEIEKIEPKGEETNNSYPKYYNKCSNIEKGRECGHIGNHDECYCTVSCQYRKLRIRL